MTKPEWVIHTPCLHFLRFNKHFLKSIYKVLCQKFSYISSHLILINILWAGNYLYFKCEKSKAERKWLAQGAWPGSGSRSMWIQSWCFALLPVVKSSCTVQLLTFSRITWAGRSAHPTTPQMTLLCQPDWCPSCQLILFSKPLFKLFLPPGILFLLLFYLGISENSFFSFGLRSGSDLLSSWELPISLVEPTFSWGLWLVCSLSNSLVFLLK